MALKDSSVTRSGGAPELGFRANLTGASLGDLVQMECLANSTLAVRVVSGHDTRYLYLQAGQIVPFEPCNAGWPSATTISKPWQVLLMQAATSRDEARRRTVVDFPRERTQGNSMHKPPIPISQPPSVRPSSGGPASGAPQSGATLGGQGIDRAVRLEPDGKLLSSRGAAEELAEVTAYTMRLATLIGERLGMDELRAIECVTRSHRRLFYVEKNGNLIGLEARVDTDLNALREKLGL
jgi:hypothetical protein